MPSDDGKKVKTIEYYPATSETQLGLSNALARDKKELDSFSKEK
jgi:hypothetical protein